MILGHNISLMTEGKMQLALLAFFYRFRAQVGKKLVGGGVNEDSLKLLREIPKTVTVIPSLFD